MEEKQGEEAVAAGEENENAEEGEGKEEGGIDPMKMDPEEQE